MEPLESAAVKKCNKKISAKNLNQGTWVSEPTASSKRSSFADSQEKKHLQCEDVQSSDSAAMGLTERCSPGTPPSPAVSHSSHESEFHQPFSSAFSHKSLHSYPQLPARETLPVATKARLQPGMDTRDCAFTGQPQSSTPVDLFQGCSRGRGAVLTRRKSPNFPFGKHSQSGKGQLEDTHKKEQRSKKPGKYICHYCGRACAKPSVLKKHIRSHTGERPYPCGPCGFSFKTKSNLYKHRKSHAHAIKAGLVPFSELASTRVDTDQASTLEEGEVHSDGEQSTDTDEDVCEVMTLLGKSSPLPHLPLEVDRSTTGKGASEKAEFSEERARGSANVPLLIIPKQGILLPAAQCPKLAEMEASPVSPRGAVEECHTVKQRLALRLHEKKGQDSESSFNLLSPHSKGSTDSGYFSRSESSEQQVSPPITNAKSYEEIMFGKYYRPSPRPRQSITVGMATVAPKDTNIADMTGKPSVMQNLALSDISDDHVAHQYAKYKNIVDSASLHANIFLRGNFIGTQRIEGFGAKQSPPKHCQVNTVLLEEPSDAGSLMRSNSMPTSSTANLHVPPGLRGSHSFDERMKDDVFYPGSGGLRRLRRQAAFEHSSNEGHAESDTQGAIFKTTGLSGAAKLGEHSSLVPDVKAYSSYSTKIGMEGYPEFQLQLMHQRQAVESATRKRRKEKSVGEEDDSPSHCSSDHSSTIEMLGSHEDYDSKLLNQDPLRAMPTGKGSTQLHSVYSQLDSIDIGTRMSLEDRMLIQDPDRKSTGHVISVIQHTNSLSRPSSFEKSDSVDHSSYQQVKASSSYSEQSDSENTEEVQSTSPLNLRSESMEQQLSDNKAVHTPHRLVRQSNIQVPEIRVTEEPDKPQPHSPEVQVKEPEKHVEEFQWPQRSETLSQLPAEKLPPKKKRLRLAEIEHSSGESSFESTCTSLSRSPSQESNLSHTSSLSVSLDREESIKSASPLKQDDLGKQSEFLTVPGLTQHQQKEMRRSSSEQVPCTLPTEIPEVRSKSFDYGSLSSSSRQGEIYTSTSSMKERRRGYLVRQASLSVHPESAVQDKGLDAKQEQPEQMLISLHQSHPAWQGAPLPLHGTDCDALVADVTRHKRIIQPVLSLHTHPLQLRINEDNQPESHLLIQKLSYSPDPQPSGTDQQTREIPSREVAWCSSLHSSITQPPIRPFQPGIFCHQESTQRHKQHTHAHQLQKQQVKQSGVQEPPQKSLNSPPLPLEQVDSKTVRFGSDQSYLYTPKTSPYQHSDLSRAFSMSPLLVPLSEPSMPGTVVPVRVQTDVPSYGSVMYTSVSQMLVTLAQGGTSSSMIMCNVPDVFQNALTKPQISLSQILAGPERPSHSHWKVSEPMPVQINTGIPLSLTCGTISTTLASSMGGNKRLLSPASSLEFFTEIKQQKRVKEERMYGQIVEELSAVELSNSAAANDNGESQKPRPQKDDISTVSSLYTEEAYRSSHITPPRPMLLDSPEGRESPEKLEIDEQACEEGPLSTDDAEEVKPVNNDKTPETMQVENRPSEGAAAAGGSVLLTHFHQASQFLSLRTSTSVSWCFLNYTKPNNAQTASLSSVYASWSVSSFNPNPPSLSTKAALALLCSKQKKNMEIYTMAAIHQPGMGKLVSSYFCKQKSDKGEPERMQLDVIKCEKKTKGISCRERGKEDHREKEVSPKQSEPTRIKIFEGGYKSNEDYIYVRGRGRGKYLCEECGIRCKKPSMLKKHIRSHTDVRPYVCKFCHFAFKTKGNLTKHMKSKAHMKRCLELGEPVTSVEDTEVEEPDNADGEQKDCGKAGVSGVSAEHQFSDVDDSDGAEDDGDEIEEDEDEDEEYDGDSTPRTRSRSASPRPYAARDSAPKPALCSFLLSPPGVQIRSPQAQTLSPGSPRERYLSPRRDASPRGGVSPHREASPLRHITPRRRDLSPWGPCSPGPPSGAVSPRAQHRGPTRTLSPRRGAHQHSAPWDLGQYLQPEAGLLGQEQRRSSLCGEGLFSHLPLHSQQQVRTPLPMIPIGGIQVVHTAGGPAQRMDPAAACGARGPAQGPGTNAPDQALHTCTHAIATLTIAADEALEKSAESLHPPHRYQSPSEDGQDRGPQPELLPAPMDSLGSEKDGSLLGQNTFPSTSANDRQSGGQSLRETPKSTRTGEGSSKGLEYR